MRPGIISDEGHKYQRVLGELLQRSRNPLFNLSKDAAALATSHSFCYGEVAVVGAKRAFDAASTRQKKVKANGNG
jgi:hypothetical protein